MHCGIGGNVATFITEFKCELSMCDGLYFIHFYILSYSLFLFKVYYTQKKQTGCLLP